MKEKIEKLDKLLMALEVRGDSVLVLAEARVVLGEIYRDMNASRDVKKAEEKS